MEKYIQNNFTETDSYFILVNFYVSACFLVQGSEAATYDDTVSEGTAGGLHLKQQVGLTGGISIIMGTIIGKYVMYY